MIPRGMSDVRMTSGQADPIEVLTDRHGVLPRGIEQLPNLAHGQPVGALQMLGHHPAQPRYPIAVQEERAFDPDSLQWKDARLALEGLIELCRRRKIALTAVLHGNDQLFSERYTEILRNKEISHVSVSFDEQNTNSAVDGHCACA